MFVLDLWDSPATLLMDLALSVLIIVVIMMAARFANARSEGPKRDEVSPQGEAIDKAVPPGTSANSALQTSDISQSAKEH